QCCSSPTLVHHSSILDYAPCPHHTQPTPVPTLGARATVPRASDHSAHTCKVPSLAWTRRPNRQACQLAAVDVLRSGRYCTLRSNEAMVQSHHRAKQGETLSPDRPR